MPRRSWSVLSVLSLVALAVPATLAATAAPASAACPVAIVIGLHGVGERPSSSNSSTITHTFSSFQAAAAAAGEPSSSYILDPFTYPVVPVRDFESAAGLKNLSATLDSTQLALVTQVIDLRTACPTSAIELAGYSLGAWIIHMALDNVTLWNDIRAAVYYGDPCWYNSSGGYIGLVRFASATNDDTTLGCPPESVYPYEDQPPPFPVQSWCAYHDPICGQGLSPSFSPANIIHRFSLARNCSTRDGCTHFSYAGSEATTDGGRFLAQEAFGAGSAG